MCEKQIAILYDCISPHLFLSKTEIKYYLLYSLIFWESLR